MRFEVQNLRHVFESHGKRGAQHLRYIEHEVQICFTVLVISRVDEILPPWQTELRLVQLQGKGEGRNEGGRKCSRK